MSSLRRITRIPLRTRLPLLHHQHRRLTLATAAVTSVAAASGIGFWAATRSPYFVDIHPETDPLFQTQLYKSMNPNNNPTLSDLCVRRVNIAQLEPALVEDSKDGGTILVERFCQGLWGGWGFAIQRNLVRMLSKGPHGSQDIFSKGEILQSGFEEGTRVSGKLEVVSNSPSSIVFRSGVKPADPTQELRDFDGLTEAIVKLDFDDGVAEFRLKCIFFKGTGVGSPPPLPKWLAPFHFQYVRMLIQSGVWKCMK